MDTFRATAPQEEWRTVVGYEGLYEVSDHGSIRRVSGHRRGTHPGTSLKWSPGRGGYPRVCLTRPGRRTTRYVHHVVAEAFLGPRPEGAVINHKDRDKWNAHATNLEYTTVAENNRHAFRTGEPFHTRRGSAVAITRLVETDIPIIRDHSIHYREIMARFGIAKATVFRIRRREVWAHVA